jgi:Arc/MetJ family transcription regulator
MRTNVVLNDDLVAEALKLSGLKTKKSVIEAALKVLIDVKRRRSLLELQDPGLLADDYDYKAARASRA